MSSNAPAVTNPQAIVIGSGSGGLTVAIGLTRVGKQAILVEDHQVGGDCTNVGCIPSKLLLHYSHGDDSTEQPAVNGAEAMSEVRKWRDHLREEEAEEVSSGISGIDFIRGRGRVLGPGRVEVTETDGSVRILEAPNVVIATGSQPRPLEIDGLPDELRFTNENLFELDAPPQHLAIVGGGPIGVEMATAFRRLGSEVTIIEFAPQVLAGMLPEAAAVVHRSLEAMGVQILTRAKATSFDEAGGTLITEPADGDAAGGEAGADLGPVTGVDAVLVAVGRVPNSADLGLAEAGVKLDDRGHVVIDDRGRTSVDGVWAIGDVSDRGGTTHAAGAWGRRVLRSLLTGPLPLPDIPPIPNAVFGDPEVATIGEQPAEVPDDVRRISVEVASIDRAYTDRVTDGIVIVDVRRFSGQIMGATIVGPRAGELIGMFSLAMKTGIKFHQWYGTVWPYPTYADSISRAVDIYIAEALPSIHTDAVKWAASRVTSLFNRR